MLVAVLVAARLAITVATPNHVISPDLAARVAAETEAVWRGSGVDIEWSIGDRPGWQPDAPMLYVLFTDRCAAEPTDARPLASLTFVDGMPTRRIVVCRHEVDAVAALGEPSYAMLPPRARDAVTARVMGRAVAHEIGHYLFGPAHASTGLMRAQHTMAEFCAPAVAPFAIEAPGPLARSVPLR